MELDSVYIFSLLHYIAVAYTASLWEKHGRYSSIIEYRQR